MSDVEQLDRLGRWLFEWTHLVVLIAGAVVVAVLAWWAARRSAR